MVNYVCINCNKIFLLKGDYTRHMNRKTQCNKIKNNETKNPINNSEMNHKNVEINHKNDEMNHKNNEMNNKNVEMNHKINNTENVINENDFLINNEKNEDKNIKCTECKKIFKTEKYLKIHVKNSCKGHESNICKKCNCTFTTISNARRHERTCKYEEKKEAEKNPINNSTINNTNNGSIVNGNIINKNIDNKTIVNNNVTINAYGKENFEMCKIEKKFIMEYCFNSLCLYIKRIHFNKDKPENHNMFITNLKSNNVSVFDGKKIKIESYKTVLKKLNNYHYKLKFIYEEVKHDISKTCKRQFPIFLDFADESNESEFSKEYREDLSKEIKLLLYNEREMAMTTLRNKNIQLN